jgi:hypothetical protein
MSFPNPDNYARDCDCGTSGANTTPPPASLVAEASAAILTNPFLLPDGGSIDTSNNGGTGGSIITSGPYGADITTGPYGGAITVAPYGGSISTNAYGGAIDTSSYGGAITTSSHGGSITTGPYGGAINTTGSGSIGLGTLISAGGTGQTTLLGSASGTDKTITLPNFTGTLPFALFSTSTALNFTSISAGGFLDLTITLTGAATSDVVFVTCMDTGGRGPTDGKLVFEAFVSATNTVTVRAHNPTAGSIDPAAYNFKVAIIKTT